MRNLLCLMFLVSCTGHCNGRAAIRAAVPADARCIVDMEMNQGRCVAPNRDVYTCVITGNTGEYSAQCDKVTGESRAMDPYL